jgi:hypothetical protein
MSLCKQLPACSGLAGKYLDFGTDKREGVGALLRMAEATSRPEKMFTPNQHSAQAPWQY